MSKFNENVPVGEHVMRDLLVDGLKTIIITLAAIVCLTGAALLAASKVEKTAMAGAAVRLEVPSANGVCSGVHLGGGRFLTAAHCTWSGAIQIKTDRGESADAEVLWSANLYDLALLYAKGLTLQKAAVDCHLAKPGDAVSTTGNPLGLAFVRTKGQIVSGLLTGEVQIEGKAVWRERIIADMTVAPGNSGGPLFDNFGRIVGTIVGMMPPFRYAIVVPSSTICKLTA